MTDTKWYSCEAGEFPPVNVPVIAGYWFQDVWLKGDPWTWLQNIGYMMNDDHRDFKYCGGKRWCATGSSHSAITHWCYPPAPPPHP